MVQKNEVKLEDPADRFVPTGVTIPEHDGKKITLADLDTHTSGLPRMPSNFSPKDPANPYADYTAAKLYQFLSSYQLQRDPGAHWAYSNLGMGLLGQLLSQRAATDYEALLKARVLAPLRLDSTTITLTDQERARLAPGHDSSLKPAANWDLGVFDGAGGLRSTANDPSHLP